VFKFPISAMQAFYALPDEQQLRIESSLPKFIRRIKQQLDLYELSEYAFLNKADNELPYASMADLSKRRQASALIKQSITDEVLDQFPDEYSGRQIIRYMEMGASQTSTSTQDATMQRASDKYVPGFKPAVSLHASLSQSIVEAPCQNAVSGSSSASLPSWPVSPPSSTPSPSENSKQSSQVFECKKCSKVFTRYYALVSHMTCHTLEKKYSCPKCAQAGKETRFKRAWDWKRHLKTCKKPEKV
jgi:hypothetical protein